MKHITHVVPIYRTYTTQIQFLDRKYSFRRFGDKFFAYYLATTILLNLIVFYNIIYYVNKNSILYKCITHILPIFLHTFYIELRTNRFIIFTHNTL